MKKSLIAVSLIWSFLLIVSPLSGQETPSKWVFNKHFSKKYESTWVNEHFVAATVSGDGVMAARNGDGSDMEIYSLKSQRAIAGPFHGNSYFLFKIPSQQVAPGTYVTFDATLAVDPGAPMYWVVEWLDGDNWIRGHKYKCYGPAFGKKHNYTSIHQTFKLNHLHQHGVIQVRIRALAGKVIPEIEGVESTACAMLASGSYVGAYLRNLGAEAPKDTTKVLCIGNSFTYYHSSPSMLKEIAWSQGHYLDMYTSVKGGRTMKQHRKLATTKDVVKKGGYDAVILQDQSQIPAKVGSDPERYASLVNDIAAMATSVDKYSPSCRKILECTWAYPGKKYGGFGDMKTFDANAEKGIIIMSKAIDKSEVSPIAKAFRIARKKCPSVELYHTDDHHPSIYGSYLKCCVNYLVLFGEPFKGDPADCGIDPKIALTLRKIAQKAVLR